MANFKPLKQYLLMLLDQLTEKHRLSGPFLDIGAGIGDVSLHFAQKGWQGTALEISPDAARIAQKNLEPFADKVGVICGNIREHRGRYQTIFLCDILEHVPDDAGLLRHARSLMAPDAHLVISVPVYPREWRWDDDYYGHLRRYEIEPMRRLLKENGLELLTVWDFTYPFFWLLRRFYTRVIPPKRPTDVSASARTEKSSMQSAWDNGFFTTQIPKLIWWTPLLRFQSRFKTQCKGCECIFVARPLAAA